MASTWTAAIEDETASVLAFCTTIKNGTLTLPLNDYGSFNATFDITGGDFAAIIAQLNQGGTFIRIAENGTTRFWGGLTDLQVDVSDDSAVTASFGDVSSQFAHVASLNYEVETTVNHGTASSPLYIAKPRAYKGTQSAILSSIRTHYGNSFLTGDYYGPLVTSSQSGSSSKTRTVTAGTSSMLEVLKSISDLAYGIEWYVTPDKTITFADTLGTDKSSSVVFQFRNAGRSNVVSITSQYLPPRNVIWVNGDDNILRRRAWDTSSLTKFGEYSQIINKTNRASESDQDLADGRLRPNWRQTIEVNVEPSWSQRPWSTYYLGDRIALDLKQGAWSYVGNHRLNQIEFVFDDNMVETDLKTTFEVV